MNLVSWVLLAMAVASSVMVTYFMFIAASAISKRWEVHAGPWRQFGLQMLLFIVFMGTIWAVAMLVEATGCWK